MELQKTHRTVFDGGTLAGALFALFSIAVFLIDAPALRSFLPALRLLVVALWALRLWEADK